MCWLCTLLSSGLPRCSLPSLSLSLSTMYSGCRHHCPPSVTLNGRIQRRKDAASRAVLALGRGGWWGLVIQEKRPLRLPGKTTDFTNAEAEPQSRKLCVQAGGLCSLFPVPVPQFYEESHCRGLAGHGVPACSEEQEPIQHRV